MELYEKIITIYPELASNSAKAFWDGTVRLRQDDEDAGAYIEEWNYEQPQPTEAQLAALDYPSE